MSRTMCHTKAQQRKIVRDFYKNSTPPQGYTDEQVDEEIRAVLTAIATGQLDDVREHLAARLGF